MDLFAHVHGEYEGEPACAEVGAGLDPADTQLHHYVYICMKDLWKINTQTGCHLSDLCTLYSGVLVMQLIWKLKLFKQLFLLTIALEKIYCGSKMEILLQMRDSTQVFNCMSVLFFMDRFCYIKRIIQPVKFFLKKIQTSLQPNFRHKTTTEIYLIY